MPLVNARSAAGEPISGSDFIPQSGPEDSHDVRVEEFLRGRRTGFGSQDSDLFQVRTLLRLGPDLDSIIDPT